MKKWLSMLLFTGIGFGMGFFTGKRLGEQKKEKTRTLEDLTYNHDGERLIAEVTQKDANGLALTLGYADGDQDEDYAMQKEVTDQYFAQFEHPADEDEGEETAEKDDEIEIISYDEYEAETDYEHKSLYFYTEDLVVCDEDEKRLDDPEELIGHEALIILSSGEAGAVCVRNHWMESVYLVEAIDNAYGRVVLGIEDEYPIN